MPQRLSIVITTHNRPNLLRRALTSVLAFQSTDYEVLLCADDCSKETITVAYELLRPQDTFVQGPNLVGPAQSRNVGLSLASGGWVVFLDDDDTFSPSHITNILKSIPTLENSVYFSNYTEIHETRRHGGVDELRQVARDVRTYSASDLCVNNLFPINSLLLPTHLLKQHQFDHHLQSHEDWDFLLSLAASGVSFKWLPGPADEVRVHINSTGSTRNTIAALGLDYLSIYRKWPAADLRTKQLRVKKLKQLGLAVPEKYL